MSVTVDANGVHLVGDGFGGNGAVTHLNEYNPAAIRMDIVWRGWYNQYGVNPDGNNGVAQHTGAGWNHTNGFGLRFSSSLIEYTSIGDGSYDDYAPTDFIGWTSLGPVREKNFATVFTDYVGVYTEPNVDELARPGYYKNTIGLGIDKAYFAIFNGANAKVDNRNSISNEWDTGLDGYEQLISWGRNPTLGAKYTWGMRVYGSVLDNSVWLRLALDNTSIVEGDDMFDIFDSGNVYNALWQIHGDTTSNWRNAGSPGTMNFPRYLMLRSSLPSQELVLKYFKVRFYDPFDTVTNEEVIA